MLKVTNVTSGYDKKIVLRDITFELHEKEILCILGPNGSGKSTLLKTLLKLIPLKNGNILIKNQDIYRLNYKEMAKYFSYIPQRDSMLFPYTVLEMVTMGRVSHLGAFRVPSEIDYAISYRALEQLQITHLKDKIYSHLSGGEKQLILIARALCQDSNILVMDEPTSSLDYANQQLIMNAIRKVASHGRSVIMTTHSTIEPFQLATNVLLLKDGNMTSFGKPMDVLTPANLESVFNIPFDIVSVTDRHNQVRNLCILVDKENG